MNGGDDRAVRDRIDDRNGSAFGDSVNRIDQISRAAGDDAHLPMVLEMTHRVLAHISTQGLDVCADVLTVPGDVFTSAERFEADRRLMRSTPHVVAWSGEFPNAGDYTTKEVAGTSILLVRGKDGRPRALSNACLHRGSRVASGCGNTRRFTCPYHAWSYDTEGLLKSLPQKSMFAGALLEGRGLRPLPVSEQAGLVVVGLDDEVDVEGFLGEMTEELAGYGFERYAHSRTDTVELRANWKLVVDVNFEGYHFPYLHEKTLAPICSNNSVFDVFGRHCRWAFPFRVIEEQASMPESSWPERFNGTVAFGIFPSCVLVETPLSTQMLRIYPGASPGTSVAHISGGSFEPIVDNDARALSELALDGANKVLQDEDFPAAESCHAGIEQTGQAVIIGRCEPLVQHFHNAWDDAVRPH